MPRSIEWQLYTDGACRPNPGFGGWAFILRKKERKLSDEDVVLSGGEIETTNNRMELQAVLEGFRYYLNHIKSDKLILVSDSKYLINGIEEWCDGWIKNGWKKSDGGDVLNVDLWQEIHGLSKQIDLKCIHVRGHTGHVENERVDELAGQALKRIRNKEKKNVRKKKT